MKRGDTAPGGTRKEDGGTLTPASFPEGDAGINAPPSNRKDNNPTPTDSRTS
jgi:hypothetical protein